MPLVMILCVLPLAGGAAAEYAVCRYLRKWPWRWLLPVLTVAVAGVVAAARFYGWSMEAAGGKAPLETLLIIPTLPAVLVLAGLFLGWRLWKWRWRPRIIRTKKGKR